MKTTQKLLFAAAVAACTISFGAEPLKLPFNIDPRIPRKIEIGKSAVLTLSPGNFEVVQCSWYPAVELAAREIAEATVGRAATEQRSALIMGCFRSVKGDLNLIDMKGAEKICLFFGQ